MQTVAVTFTSNFWLYRSGHECFNSAWVARAVRYRRSCGLALVRRTSLVSQGLRAHCARVDSPGVCASPLDTAMYSVSVFDGGEETFCVTWQVYTHPSLFTMDLSMSIADSVTVPRSVCTKSGSVHAIRRVTGRPLLVPALMDELFPVFVLFSWAVETENVVHILHNSCHVCHPASHLMCAQCQPHPAGPHSLGWPLHGTNNV